MSTNNLSFRLLAALAPAMGLALTVGLPQTAQADQCVEAQTYEFTGLTTQLGRVFRDAIPSACPDTKAYPGIFNAGTTVNYETVTIANPIAGPLCVTIDFNPDTAGAVPCGTNAHASAYVGTYDPNDQATNFIGDVGSSIAQPFSVIVPGLTDLVVVVTNTSSAAICNFAVNTDLCSVCGDAIITLDEECDLGAETATCDADCTLAVCGDGYVNPLTTEACDDGNEANGDGCDINCTVSACGNGVVASEEACDDGNLVDGDGCEANCTVTPACGDGNVDDGEACDDGNDTDGDGCEANCTVTPACGDGNVDDGEACDDGNDTNGDGCETDCTISPACGDGTQDAGEACDDGNTDNGDGCSAACAVEVAPPAAEGEDSNGCCQTGDDNGAASIALGLFIGLVLMRRR